MDIEMVSQHIKRADLLQMYYYLLLTRSLEDRITALYRQGRIVGGCYTSHGMEAIAVGYASAIERDDVIAPFHRDMGAFLIRGITPGEVLAQYLGKRTGPTKGKDGNVHMGDLKRGVLGFVSHLADNLPVATGAALAFKIRGESRVVVAGTGDGGTSRGDFHEAMNFAAVRKLPVVFFCNNNQYAYSTPQRLQMAITDVVDRAMAYGMPGRSWTGTTWQPCIWRRSAPPREPARAKGRHSSSSRPCACMGIPSTTRPNTFPMNSWRSGRRKTRS